MVTYLEMKEIVSTPLDDVGVFLRIEVLDKDQALALRPALEAQFFGSKPHSDKLHFHIPMGSCTSEDI